MSVRCVSIEVISLREDAKEKRTARDFRVDVRAAHCCVAINAMGCSLIERRVLSTAVCRGCFLAFFLVVASSQICPLRKTSCAFSGCKGTILLSNTQI